MLRYRKIRNRYFESNSPEMERMLEDLKSHAAKEIQKDRERTVS